MANATWIIHAGRMSRSAAENTEYTVVVRSRAGARVRCGYYVDLTNFPDGAGGQVQVRVSMRWDDIGLDYPAPRELWMAVRVEAADLDSAVRSAMWATSVLAVLISFCVNAVVEPPALHLAFNSSEGLSRREFMEAFNPIERGHPRPGRWIEPQAIFAFAQAALASTEGSRLARALAQYQTALRYWNSGSRILVLAHLYIASEALTNAVLRVHQARLGVAEHARLLGVDLTKGNWKMMAGNFARREYVFEGETAVHQRAMRAAGHGTILRQHVELAPACGVPEVRLASGLR